MKVIKALAIVLGVYVGVVIAAESLVGIAGGRHASRGVAADENWVVLTTTDAGGRSLDTVVAGMESGGQLYVAANHWPRAWYNRAVANPDVMVARAGEKTARRAVQVAGEERDRVARDYRLPWVLRFITGFPPRSFLRLDPR